MSLLREIQAATIDSSVKLADIMRKCKILATRLANREFRRWVDKELDGYGPEDELPPYRIIPAHAIGHFSGPFGSGLRNAPIPSNTIPEKFRHFATEVQLRQSVGSLEEMVSRAKGDGLTSPWPGDLVAYVGQKIYQDMNCLAAWTKLPAAGVFGVLNTVRNRILSFVLEIEAEAPDAGEAEPNAEPVPQERVTQVFNTHIAGDVGSLAAGSHDFTQTSMMPVQQGNLDSLKAYLEAVGVSSSDIKDLEKALTADARKGGKSEIGERTSGWLAGMLRKASSGALDLTIATAGTVLGTAISSYLGLIP